MGEGGDVGGEKMLMIVISAVLGLAAGLYWMTGRWLALYGINGKKTGVRIARGLAAVLAIAANVMWYAALLVELHLLALFAVTEFTAWLLRRLAKRYSGTKCYAVFRRIYRSGLVPVFAMCLILGWGFRNMGQIGAAEYTVTSEKLDSCYDVVFLSDIHYDTVQDPDVLNRAMEEINALQPDIIILGGDIVEEGTSKESMEEAFRTLGNLRSVYGTYYIYGNHDRQRYLPDSSRSYTEEELEQAITTNGIEILCDRYITLEKDLLLVGREDVGESYGRIPMRDLLLGADKERFLLVADHQPADAEENALERVDLQLSGHTHAGQIFPAGHLIELFGGLNYGLYREGDCQVIVSSGAAGWGFPFRTQGRCEYVVVHLRGTDFP